MTQPLTDAINSLITYSNSVTGASDQTLSEAVATLASGYGGGGVSIDDFASGAEPNGVITLNTASTIGNNALRQRINLTGIIGTSVITTGTSSVEACNALTSISFPVLTTVGDYSFRNCTHLTTISLPEATTINQYGFGGCTQLNNVSLPKLTRIRNNGFEGCTSLTKAEFPLVTVINTSGLRNCRFPTIVLPSLITAETYCLCNNPNLTAVDFPVLKEFTGGSAFADDTQLTTIVIRTSTMATCSNLNHFNNTPFASGKAGGTLYVPQSLISSYQSANNWSTILGYANNSIKSIESTHTDPNAPIDLTLYYADGTLIE